MSRATRFSTVCLSFVFIALFAFTGSAWAAADTTTTTVCSASPASPQNVGTSVTFTVEVRNTQGGTPNNSPGGTAQFTVTNNGVTTNLGSPVTLVAQNCGGTASTTRARAQITTTSLPGGTNTIKASYTPSDTSLWQASSDVVGVAYTINKLTPTIAKPAVVSPVGSPVIGQGVTFNVVVTGTAGVQLDGAVQFFDGTTWIGDGNVPVSTSGSSTATFSTASLTQGAHASINAVYVGNASYNASAASANANSLTVNKRATAVTVPSVTPSPAGVGVASNVNVQVADNDVVPSGSRGGFAATGSLGAARSRHASAVLPNGSVLITGGMDNTGTVLGTSFIFSGGTFTSTGVLGTARTGHTATLLQDGTVLVTGGSSSANGAASGALRSAEIFDPVSGTFSGLACNPNCLSVARTNHTATLMPNGNVLIAGGENGGGTLQSVSVYDPAAKTFTALASPANDLVAARRGHTATLISGGSPATILIVGGDTGTAELYSYTAGSPGSGTSAATSTPIAARNFHTATLLPDGLVLIMGGETASAALDSIEFFNPSGAVFTAASGTLPSDTTTTRQGQTADLLQDGTVLMVGGASTLDTPSTAYASAFIYTPAYDPTGAATITAQDSTPVTPVADTTSNGTCATLLPNGTGTLSCVGSVTATGINTNPHVVTGTYAATGVHLGNNGTANVTVLAALTVTAQADTKTYDGTFAPSSPAVVPVLTGTLTGTDKFCGTQQFLNKNVAIGNAVTEPVKTLVIRDNNDCVAGTDHTANYAITYVNNTASTINKRTLTVTATASSANKTYDGTPAAPGQTLADNRVGGDVLTLSFTAAFLDKNVLTGKTVNVTAIAISGGTDQGNYTLGNTTASTTADISARTLTVSGVANSANKTYDGTPAAPGQTLSDDRVGGDVLTVTLTSASFVDKNVGTGKTVNITGIAITGGADQGNYTLGNTTASSTANISGRTLTVTANAGSANKTYDGSPAASGQTLADDRVGGDLLTLSFTANFVDKNVGTGKTVNVTAIAISGGADQGNYTLGNTTASTTANISVRTLTVSGVANSANKTYNGTAAAPGQTLSDDRVGGDVLTFTFTASFADKNVATGKTVSITAIAISGGTDQGNYTLGNTTASTTADISARTLTVSGVANSANKTYDGSAAAPGQTVTDDRVGGDLLTLSFTANFVNKNVANGKTVNITAIAISGGTDQGNYSLGNTTASTTANITARTLNVTANANSADKTYNGTAAAPGQTLSDDRVGGDVLTFSFTAGFLDKNVGVGKTVNVTAIAISGGADQGNYTLGNTTASTTANITVRTLNVTANASSANKTYDGSAAAPGQTLADDRVGGDVLTFTFTASFADKTVGNGKTVSVTAIAISGGTDQGNYVLGNTTASTTANITALAITGSITASDKVYDGTAVAAIATRSLSGVVLGDVVTYTGGTATFSDKNVGVGKTVSATGLGLTGADAGNYTVNSAASTTASITVRTLNVTANASSANKVYDSTAAAAAQTLSDNRVGGDLLTLSFSASFIDKNVATGKTVNVTGIAISSGADQGNYTLGNTTASTTADITAFGITGSITASNKAYDSTVAATIATRTLTGVIGADVVTYTGGTATFNDKTIGTGKTVTATGLSLTGADAGNYTVNTTATTTADITPIPVTITGAVGVDKVYDRTTVATVNFGGASLVGLISGDTVTINSAGYSASYADKLVGSAKAITVIGVVLAGADAGNYTLSQPAGLTANITALSITGSVTASDKVYDATPVATLATRTLAGVISGDVVSYTGGTAAFTDKNVGTAKAVTATGLTLSGTDAGNYVVNSAAATTANISQAPLTVSATGIDKVYDSTTVATVTLSDNRISGDVLTTAYTAAAFSNANVGAGKAVSVTGISISGTDAANYSFNTTAGTSANITARPITITANSFGKVLGTLYTFTGKEFTQTGLASGDTLVTVTLSSAGTPAAAVFGTYPIKIAALSSGNYTGTLVTTNYSITLVDGAMAVGQASTITSVVTGLTVANSASGGTLTFTVTVGSATSGTPTGTVAITDNGAAIPGSPVTLTAGLATLSSITLAPSATPHVIVATYSGDVNYKSSTVTVNVTVAPQPPAIVAGTTGGAAAPSFSVAYSGALTTSGTLSNSDLTCAVQSAVVAVVPAITSCTATLNPSPLAANGTGTVTIAIKTSAGSVSSLRPLNGPSGPTFRALYAMSLAMPAFAFIGLALPLGGNRKKSLRQKVLVWLGLALVASMLLVSVGCGGGAGFTNSSNLPAVGSVNRTQAGSYTAVVTYVDAAGKTQVLASMPFVVN